MELFSKLLTDAVSFGKNFSMLTRIGQVATIVILLYVAFLVGNCSKPSTDSALEITVEQIKNYTNELETRVVTLQDTVAQKETTINKLKIEISVRQRQRAADRAELARLATLSQNERDSLVKITPFTDTLITQLQEQLVAADQLIELKDSIIVKREEQIKLLQRALVISETRADTLQHTLNMALRAHQKKDKLFGKIPLPPRTAVAAAAFIGGVYVGTGIVR